MRHVFLYAVLILGARAAYGQELVAELPIKGGLIAVRNIGDSDSFGVTGIDFMSSNGGLIPAPGGGRPDPAPFDFVLANTTEQVSYGSIGTAHVYRADSCTVLNIGVQPDAEFAWSWGMPPAPIFRDFRWVNQTCAVPEPQAALIFALGACVIGSFQRCVERNRRSTGTGL